MKFNKSVVELDGVCLWYHPLKRWVMCCHEMHWTEQEQENTPAYDALEMTGEPWPEHICKACILGECDTMKHKGAS